jgi:hypothetical protein
LVTAEGITADDFEPVAYGALALGSLMWCVPCIPSCGGSHLPRRILYLTGLASHIYMVFRTINTYAIGLREGAFESPIPTISDVAKFIQDDCQCKKDERFYISDYSRYPRGTDMVPLVLSTGPIIPVTFTAGLCWLLLVCNGGGGGDCRSCIARSVGDDLSDRAFRPENSRSVHPKKVSGRQVRGTASQISGSSGAHIEMASSEGRPSALASRLPLPPTPQVPLTTEEYKRQKEEINLARQYDLGWMSFGNCLVQSILSCIGCSIAFDQSAQECFDFVGNPN